MHEKAKNELAQCHEKLSNYEEACLEQSLKIDSQMQLLVQMEDQLNEQASQLNSAELQVQLLSDIQEKYQL